MKRPLLHLMLLCSLSTWATTYYCSPAGTGHGRDYQHPTSFASGLNALQSPGDTLYLLGGQYDLGKTTVNKSGSSSRRIVIAGYPGETAILDFRTTPYGTRGLQISSSSSYVHVRDLTLRYSGKNNLYCEGSNCLFERLDIYGSADTGCQMKNGGGNTILNCDSHDNFDYQNGTLSNADFGGNADGFADKQHSGPSNTYIGCRAWNNSDDGWDFFQRNNSSDTHPTIFENCVCYLNGMAEYDMRNHPRYQTDKAWFDNVVGKTITNRYDQQQVVTLEHYPNHGNGNGFKLGGGGTLHNVVLHHCLSVANRERGFDQNNDNGSMSLYNCTGYLNGVNYGFTTAYGSNTLVNCVTWAGVNGDSYKAKTVTRTDHNSWNTASLKCNASDFVSLDTTEILRPRLSDGSLYVFQPTAGLLHLVSGSDLIDAGVPLGYAYWGAAPDLGCFERQQGNYTGDSIPTPPAPYECHEGAHRVAYVSIDGATEDQAILTYLRANDSLCVTLTDVFEPSTDYSSFEAIIISPTPSSSAAGFGPLKGYPLPMLVLKPFLFKNTVWNFGSAINTQDLSIHVLDTTHVLFTGIDVSDSEVQLFSECRTNAVTAISPWNNLSPEVLATPASHAQASTLAILQPGTVCGDVTLSEQLIMLGVSEYSTAALTEDGLRLIENCLLHLLGLPLEKNLETGLTSPDREPAATKFFRSGHILILRGAHTYTLTGTRVD